MANEKRVRQNFIGGLVDTADLAAAGTTFNSAALAAITTTIDTTNHMAITLDPDGIYGAPEIAYITALTVGATSATIVRGQEGTTARQHLMDTPWVHAPTIYDTVGDGSWQVPTYQNSWADVGSGRTTKYRKVSGDRVELQLGAVAPGSQTTMFTLPAGYRPGQTLDIPVALYNSGSPALSTVYIDIAANGVVQALTTAVVAPASGLQVLGCLSYRAEG